MAGSQVLEGVAGKKGRDLLQGDLQFLRKKYWEILTKNLVTFKSCDGVKDEKFYFYGGSLKNINQYIGWRELPKKGESGAWTFCRFKRGLYKKEGALLREG